MGIGNTSTASVLMSILLDLPIEDCVGSGTGVMDKKLIQKQNILKKALEWHAVGFYLKKVDNHPKLINNSNFFVFGSNRAAVKNNRVKFYQFNKYLLLTQHELYFNCY